MGSNSKSVVLSPRCQDYINQAAKIEDSYVDPVEKEKLWDKIADEFLMAGIPKEQISTEVRNSIQHQMIVNYKEQGLEIPEQEAKINSGHYYRWARKRNYTNPYFSRNTEDVASGNTEDSSENTKELSEKEPFFEQRRKLVFIIDELKQSLSEDKKLILDKEISLETWTKFFEDQSEEKKYLDFLQGIFLAHMDDVMRCRDTRQIILPTERFLVTAINCFAFDSWYCKKYHAIVKNRSIITPKKLAIYRNDLMSFSALINHTMEDPMNLHFLDIKCPECNRYLLKTVYNIDGTWHIICTNEIKHNDKKPVFPASMITERLEQLSKNKGGATTAFLKERNITVSDNEPKKA